MRILVNLWFGGHRMSLEGWAFEQSGGCPCAQLTGAVNSAFTVREQPALAEKLAVTLTGAPFDCSPVSVTLCGLVPIGNDWPFTTRLPDAGGFE